MRFDGSCCHNLLPVTNQSWNISVCVTTKVGFDSIPVALWITDIHVLWKWCLLTGYISVKRLKRLLEKRWRLFSPWRLKVSTALVCILLKRRPYCCSTRKRVACRVPLGIVPKIQESLLWHRPGKRARTQELSYPQELFQKAWILCLRFAINESSKLICYLFFGHW